MEKKKKDSAQNKTASDLLRGLNDFKLVSKYYSTWKMPHTLVALPKSDGVCRKCRRKLQDDYTLIPSDSLEPDQRIKVPGLFCSSCQILYVLNHEDELRQILTDNQKAKDFTLNGEPLWNKSERERFRAREEERKREIKRWLEEQDSFMKRMRAEQEQWLKEVPNGVIRIGIKYSDGKNPLTETYSILGGRKRISSGMLLHYSDPKARELLSAISPHRNGVGKLGGRRFAVLGKIYRSEKKDSFFLSFSPEDAIPEELVPTSICLRKGAGYYDPERRLREEVVDVLLYSLKTEQYELIRASQDISTGVCYTDSRFFRAFIEKYGKPDLMPSFSGNPTKPSSFGSRIEWDDLNTESFLRAYGYSVSQKDGFSSAYRQALLAEVVDLEYLTPEQIVSHLLWCISTHPGYAYSIAEGKWKEDIEFVRNYKVNPERFLLC